jgi:hypothetical protein
MNRHQRRASVKSIRHSDLITHLIAADMSLDDHATLHNAVLHWYSNIVVRKPVCIGCKASFLDDENAGGCLPAVIAGRRARHRRKERVLCAMPSDAVDERGRCRQRPRAPANCAARPIFGCAMRPLRHPLLPAGPGHRTPATLLAIDERNALLAEIARRFYPGLSHREIAHRLRSRLLIYRNGPWRRTCTELRSPHPPEKIETLLWQLLRVRDAIPGERTMRAALARTSIRCPPTDE